MGEAAEAAKEGEADGESIGAGSAGSAEPEASKAPHGGEDREGSHMNKKQKLFLQNQLDSITKMNAELASENRILKVQRLPALQASVKKLQAENQELKKLLDEERRKNHH